MSVQKEREKPGHWLVRRATETFLVLMIFMGGFLAREFLPYGQLPGTASSTPLEQEADSEEDLATGSGPLLPEERTLFTMKRQSVAVTVPLSGRVTFDPGRVLEVATTFPARVERLYTTSPGLRVQAGEPLLQVFFPESTEAQTALLTALASQRETGGAGAGFLGKLKSRNVEEARAALRRIGLTAQQIKDVEQAQNVSEYLLFRSPLQGNLVTVEARTGQFVQPGETLCTVADLSVVRVTMEARQQDLDWLRYGQPVRFIAEGRETWPLHGRIAALGVATEELGDTWDVHVQVSNSHGLLRPGMRVMGTVVCEAVGPASVTDPNLAGQWLCPVHPDEVAAQAGDCSVCSRARVPAASLGYVNLSSETALPLVVPQSAIYIQSKKPVVTVKTADESYLVRPVVLGGSLGTYQVVERGLEEEELVVVPMRQW